MYVGFTPDYKKNPPLKMDGGLNEKNRKANDRAKSLLTTGVFRSPTKFNIDNKDQRRIWPLEYRGANLSNCMYTTMVSFKEGRKHQKPLSIDHPDLNYPIGGGQVN